MTEKQKAIIENKSFARFGSSNADQTKRMKNEIFMEGAAAMDELDKWISVDTELPQAMEGHSWSADVLCTDGKDYFLENYNAELKYWSCSGVTHWQQIIPPKK